MNAAAMFGFGSDEFALAQPERLWWLLPLIAVSLAIRFGTRADAIGWPALATAIRAGARRGDRLAGAAVALRVLALLALATALARPVGIHRAPPEPGFGLDLVLVVDASGSMRSVDTQIEGERRSRLELARLVLSRFAQTRVAAGDRVALVIFGESAFTPCPLTGDAALVRSALERVEPGVAGEATALGDALALAVKRAIAGRPSAAPRGPGDGRAIVLLTDGRNNTGALSLELATAIARDEGIRVHTVAIGTEGAATPLASAPPMPTDPDPGAFRTPGPLRFERHDVDRPALERVARATGGRFFEATRADHLDAVYREIDALERVARPLPPRIRFSDRPEAALAFAGACLIVEIGILRVFRRRIP